MGGCVLKSAFELGLFSGETGGLGFAAGLQLGIEAGELLLRSPPAESSRRSGAAFGTEVPATIGSEAHGCTVSPSL